MGTVYMAEQEQPVRRKIALKIIKPGMDSHQVIARFEAERQALAMMDHQNIARVLDAGTTESGRPYFVMELIHGVPITQFCDDRHLTPRERLELFVPVCQAIQHAHQRGIIHRDIKPSNVLVTMYDDKPVPKVIDFGVAKAIEQRLTEKTLFTQFGALVGTFEYMSPEQAEMNAFGVDTRSDVYSLGVLLYELLTGSTPLERERLRTAALHELVRLIKEEEAPRPSVRLSGSDLLPKIAAARKTEPQRLPRLMRGELDWIVMKCLEKDRSRRYDAASGLARDIERYLADEAVEACPPSASYRLRKFARKYRTPLQIACAFLLLLVLGTVASTWQAIRATVAESAAETRKREANDARAQAEKRRDELARVNDSLHRASYVADMNLAHHAWADNNLIRTRQLLERHRPQPGEPDLRGFEWHYLRRLFHGELITVQAHATVSTVAFTPDGKRLVSCGRSQAPREMSSGKGVTREIKLWDAATGRQLPLAIRGSTDKARQVTLSPDGTRLAAACLDQGVTVWDLATGEPITLNRHAKELDFLVSFSPDGKRLVSISMPNEDNTRNVDYKARLWDLAARKVIATIEKPFYIRTAPDFSPDGKLLAFAAYSQSVARVFDAATAREAFSVEYGDGRVAHAVFSPDGKLLAACGELGVRLWDVASRKAVASWSAASNMGNCLAFSPDGRRLASGGIEGAVDLWDTGTAQKAATFNGNAGGIQTIAFSPDGNRLASAAADGTLRLWDTTGRRESVPLSSSDSNIHSALSPDGQTVFTLIVTGKSIRFWDALTGQPRGEPIPIEQSASLNSSYDWTADGKRLLFCDAGKHIKICDAATGKVVRAFPVDADGERILAVSPDGKWCAHAVSGGTIKVRDAETGALVRTIKGLSDQVHYLVFSPDGSRLLGTDDSGALEIWDRETGLETAATRLSNIFVWRIRFSPDGNRLAVVGVRQPSLNGEVRILDASSGRELLALEGHSLNVMDAAFSPDGERLATCGFDRTVRLWDLTAGQEILTLRGHKLAVHSLRFVSDGHRLLSASGDRTIRVWDATPLPE